MYLKWFLVTELTMMRHLNTLMMFTRSYIVTVSIVVMTLLSVVSHSLANFVVDRLTVTLVHIMTLNQKNDIVSTSFHFHLSFIVMILDSVCLNSTSWPIFLVF